MKLLGKTSHYDKILAYMKNPNAEISELTDHEREMLDRWNEAFSLMRNYNTTADAAAILMKRFPGLSRATAYRDCSNAISLFGDISKSTKEGIRHLSTEITRDAIQIARIKNNEDAMIRGAESIAKINGVNINDPDLPDFDQLEPHTYELSLPDNAIRALQYMIASGKIDLNGLVNTMAETAEDAEIIEDPKPLDDENTGS